MTKTFAAVILATVAAAGANTVAAVSPAELPPCVTGNGDVYVLGADTPVGCDATPGMSLHIIGLGPADCLDAGGQPGNGVCYDVDF